MVVSRLVFAGALALCLHASSAQAHIRLLEPASWIEEDGLGDPQKTGPCGPGQGESFTETGEVTTYRAGETITVKWVETVGHPGHFRIALAENRDDLVDPEIEYDMFCNPTGPIQFSNELPVLADNVHPRTTAPGFGTETMFEHQVTLPADMTCERCTLQVIQYMTQHLPSCFYYHCADIEIVAADGAPTDAGVAGGSGAGSAGSGGSDAGEGGAAAGTGGTGDGTMTPPMTAAGSGAAGTTGMNSSGIGAGGAQAGSAGAGAGMPAAGAAPSTPASSSSSGGCVAAGHPRGAGALAVLPLAWLALRARRRRAAGIR